MKHSQKTDRPRTGEPSTFAISINPAQQAELYFDIELLICDSANTFLMHEYRSGRMSVDSLKKVTDFWKSKGRPQVLEFYYDQSTQRDLIVANQKTFTFYGPNANNPLQVHGMLYAWKSDAREMAIRTFCYPDAMIRKHVHDTFIILDFLGGQPAQYLALCEVQSKFNHWVQEAQQQHAARTSSATESRAKSQQSTSGLSADMVINNPWHHSTVPTPRQGTEQGHFGHTLN
jgi:hypothetical protein